MPTISIKLIRLLRILGGEIFSKIYRLFLTDNMIDFI